MTATRLLWQKSVCTSADKLMPQGDPLAAPVFPAEQWYSITIPKDYRLWRGIADKETPRAANQLVSIIGAVPGVDEAHVTFHVTEIRKNTLPYIDDTHCGGSDRRFRHLSVQYMIYIYIYLCCYPRPTTMEIKNCAPHRAVQSITSIPFLP